MSDWKITDLELSLIALTKEQQEELKAIDDFVVANPLFSWNEYKAWFNKIEAFDKNKLIYKYIRPKILTYSPLGSRNYLYINSDWGGFRTKAEFVKIGITTVPKLLEYYFPNSKKIQTRFMESRLLFIPVTKNLSVIVALYD